MREGNLEAPTRHPIDWKNPDFYDEAKALAEMERVFDICHGCRRCVSLCQSFPNLFDLVDATADGEVHGVRKEDYWKVVDQCYLCDLCYMTKCPYTPPHAWNLDFPHLMLRAKAIKHRKGEVKASEQLLASPMCTAASPASRSWWTSSTRSTPRRRCALMDGAGRAPRGLDARPWRPSASAGGAR
jgi:glycerol-3-phosphate dehydrogenase subunit C